MAIPVSNWSELDDNAKSALLERPAVRSDVDISAEVARIVALVRDTGDTAIRELSQQLDSAHLESLRVSEHEMAAATAEL
ncbi:MAG: histidinol dehydrogenase, partial [Gammaproteobacteria bacterium]|nr:histidinol dehydrogenase [Gammaproteobacteria bacterium]